jgi:hypothetical protein
LHFALLLQHTQVFFQPLAWVHHFLCQWGHHKILQVHAQY